MKDVKRIICIENIFGPIFPWGLQTFCDVWRTRNFHPHKNDDPDFDISFSDIFAGKMDDIIVTDTIVIMPTKQV